MKAFILRLLRHTRVVQSGSPPLYRLMLIGAVFSGAAQLLMGHATQSVDENSPPWFDHIFIVMQLIASIACLASLYMIDENKFHARKLNRSLNIELIGLVFLQTTIAVNVAAVLLMNEGPPASQGTWFTIMFWLWAWTRMWEIRRAIKELISKEEKVPR